LALPPNRTGGFPASGSQVSGFVVLDTQLMPNPASTPAGEPAAGFRSDQAAFLAFKNARPAPLFRHRGQTTKCQPGLTPNPEAESPALAD